VSIRYDGNYIWVDDTDDLVLDAVAFWNMEPGTPVNFVRGDDKRMKKTRAKDKSLLRASAVTSSDTSSSFSSSIDSSDSGDTSFSSDSNDSSDSSSSFVSRSDSSESSNDVEEDFEDLVLLAPVQEERVKRLGGD